MECRLAEGYSLVLLVNVGLWSLLAIWWIVNYKYRNRQYTKPIHFILSFALIFKVVSTVFYYLLYSVCDPEFQHYYDLGFNSTNTIFNTFLFTIFILMSKGLSLTREYLERNEVSLIALIMGVIYLGFSAYAIDKTTLKPVLIIMLSVLWYETHKNSSKVISILKQRHTLMRINNLTRTLLATETKISMMRAFNILTNLVFFTQLLSILAEIILVLLEKESEELWASLLVGFAEGTLLVGVFGICFAFMPKFRGAFFDMADFESTDEIREIVPLFEFDRDAQLESPQADRPFILKLPTGEVGMAEGIMVAVPLQQSFRRQSRDDLREPLLNNRYIS